MAGNNSIQILRGNNVKTNSTISQQTLLDGQPLYDKATGYLYVGDGNTIANTDAVKAGYANSAGSASSAGYATSSGSATTATTATRACRVSHNLRITVGGTNYVFDGSANTNVTVPSGGDANYAANAGYATNAGYAASSGSAASANRLTHYLYFNGNGSNTSWNGSANDTIYVPTSVGSIGQVWGVASNGRAAWIAQTEVPGTINHANTADVAYEVSGSNVTGTVSNANYATEAGSVSSSLYFNGIGNNVSWNGSSRDVIYVPTAMGSIGQVWGVDSRGRANWINQAEATAPTNMVTTNTTQTITGSKTFDAGTTFRERIIINSATSKLALSSSYITCQGNTFMMNSTPSGNILTDGSFNITTDHETANLSQTVSTTSETAFIVAWLQANSAGELLAARDNGATDLASASASAVGQRICISFLSPRGQIARLYHPSGDAVVWYTKTIIG